MIVYDAKVADIIRCSQRDELFTSDLQEDIFLILKTLGAKNYSSLRNVIPILANVWYYILTSLGNLQTLGEEYTGTLRFTNRNSLPNKLNQTLWLLLYVGGEPLYDRFLICAKSKIETSEDLTQTAKKELLSTILFMKENKLLLLRLHHSIFYINGKYYNISNRIVGIKYILLRQWLQDVSSTQSFNILGKISFIYLLYLLIRRGISARKEVVANNIIKINTGPGKLCSLCAENRKNTCATPCGHLFCWNCIYESLNYQKKLSNM